MPTTGTTNFQLDFTDLAEEAWELAGREMRSGYDLRTARRSLNLMLIDLNNRGINMWTIDEGSLPLTQGTAEYTLPADTVDLLEHVIRQNDGNTTTQSDLSITRISVSEYSNIPNKLNTGRPIQMWINRLRDAPVLHVWPVPDSDDYTLYYWRMRRIEDAGDGVETPDVVYRFLPAITAGLAYHLAMKDPELTSRVPMLEANYEKTLKFATEEDREKATLTILPRVRRV